MRGSRVKALRVTTGKARPGRLRGGPAPSPLDVEFDPAKHVWADEKPCLPVSCAEPERKPRQRGDGYDAFREVAAEARRRMRRRARLDGR